eukprot:SM000275S10324  [mRNA]  locus=s275:2973:5925:- [translate_table: standard]
MATAGGGAVSEGQRRGRGQQGLGTGDSLHDSGDLLARVATVALQSRLVAYETVDAEIDCTLPSLLAGRVAGVRIRGRGWQVIMLVTAARGSAKFFFDAKDFDHFLLHPLMTRASATAVRGRRFRFLPGTEVHWQRANLISDGLICFRGIWEFDQREYAVRLQGAPPGIHDPVQITARCCDETVREGSYKDSSEVVAQGLQSFFSSLCLDLDGTDLTINSISFCEVQQTQPRAATVPATVLSLDMLVRKFPSPQLDF